MRYAVGLPRYLFNRVFGISVVWKGGDVSLVSHNDH